MKLDGTLKIDLDLEALDIDSYDLASSVQDAIEAKIYALVDTKEMTMEFAVIADLIMAKIHKTIEGLEKDD